MVPHAICHRQNRRHYGVHQPRLSSLRTGIRAKQGQVQNRYYRGAIQDQRIPPNASRDGSRISGLRARGT